MGINEIKTVIRYVLISFKDEDGSIIKVGRQVPGEVLAFPREVLANSTINNYRFFIRWCNSSGTIAPGTTVPENDAVYTAEWYHVSIPTVNLTLYGSAESQQAMPEITITTTGPGTLPCIFLKNTTDPQYPGFIFKPTTTVYYDGRTKVTFKIADIPYVVGMTDYLTPLFTLYTDYVFTESLALGYARIAFNVVSTTQSTGD
jgi:hypothetical protein